METVFLKLIEQLNSSVITLIIILIVGAWSLYKLGGIVNRFRSHEDKIKDLQSL